MCDAACPQVIVNFLKRVTYVVAVGLSLLVDPPRAGESEWDPQFRQPYGGLRSSISKYRWDIVERGRAFTFWVKKPVEAGMLSFGQ